MKMVLGVAIFHILVTTINTVTAFAEPQIDKDFKLSGNDFKANQAVDDKPDAFEKLIIPGRTNPEEDRLIGDTLLGGYSAKRRKRALKLVVSAVGLGLRAVNKIVGGAKFLRHQAFGETVFVKSGGYVQALRDFYSVNPTNVRDLNIGSGVQGIVGDRTLRVLRHTKIIKTPALSIYQGTAKFPETIIKYKD